MEYIKKEELIKGEIYKHDNGNLVRCDIIVDNSINGNHLSGYQEGFKQTGGNFYIGTFKLATSEEKHWLNTCIEQDKFITFEEAMKTFIPEYVECIREEMHNFFGKLGTIYKVVDWNHSVSDCMLEGTTSGPTCKNRFKLSTKEAYDAQFVVKEPEFVLPEKWFIKTNLDNLPIISNWFKENKQNHINDYDSLRKDGITPTYQQLCFPGVFRYSVKYHGLSDLDNTYTEITLEQFKKYVLKEETIVEEVIEPLPQFKVIETIETITKVENNEGNQFFIGDVVKSNYSEVVHNIKNFKYNVDKTNILAITEKLPGGIGIDKIEHYIEPKIETQFKIGDIIKISTNPADGSQPEYLNNTYKIIKIRGNQLLFETNSIPPINSVLTKNAIKVN